MVRSSVNLWRNYLGWKSFFRWLWLIPVKKADDAGTQLMKMADSRAKAIIMIKSGRKKQTRGGPVTKK